MSPNLHSRRRALPAFLRPASWIKFRVAIAPLLLVAFSFCNAAQSVTLAWDASPSPGVSGYKIYYGTSSGSPGPPTDVGNVTSATVSNLNDSTKYYFSVTAYYDPSGPESARSNEVDYTTPPLYSLTVNFGTASPSGPYPYGAQVSVSASPQPGEQFARWDGDWIILASRLSADTTASIVGVDIKDLTITAIYKYTVTVTNGTGDGDYFANDTVQIVADAAPAGQKFAGWTMTGNMTLADAASQTTTFAMPSYAVTATANYSDLPKFTVTVTKGTGDGDYFAGDTVQIVADAAPAGQQFAGWTVTGNVTLANALSQTTTFKMPDSAVTVTATYTSSIWSSSTVPAVIDSGSDRAVQLGVKFRSEVAGTIRGIRFYKAAGNTGTHVGSLWSRGGTRLAYATFTNETASGWQEVSFAKPVAINANTVYVASYHTTKGHYSINTNYFASTGVDKSPLHALANGESGANGVYRYGNSSVFPNKGWNASNFWVDVVFQPN